MAKLFDLETEYQKYLKMVKLDESEMCEAQRVETRRAYYAGIGQFWIFVTTEFCEMTDDEAEAALELIRVQTLKFWEKESVKFEG